MSPLGRSIAGHIRLQRVRGLDRVQRGRLDVAMVSEIIRKQIVPSPFDLSTSFELDTTSGRDRWGRGAALGPRATGHIRLQRVQGLDRVQRGRLDVAMV